jgi:hypothetical protein
VCRACQKFIYVPEKTHLSAKKPLSAKEASACKKSICLGAVGKDADRTVLRRSQLYNEKHLCVCVKIFFFAWDSC